MVKNKKYQIPMTSARGKTYNNNNESNSTIDSSNNKNDIDNKPNQFLKSEFMGNIVTTSADI
jgi:hypothetical protein